MVDYIKTSLIMLKMSVILFGYFSFDNIYLAICQVSIIKYDLREFLIDAKEVISLLFSITVLVIAVLKMMKHVREYQRDKNKGND